MRPRSDLDGIGLQAQALGRAAAGVPLCAPMLDAPAVPGVVPDVFEDRQFLGGEDTNVFFAGNEIFGVDDIPRGDVLTVDRARIGARMREDLRHGDQAFKSKIASSHVTASRKALKSAGLPATVMVFAVQ